MFCPSSDSVSSECLVNFHVVFFSQFLVSSLGFQHLFVSVTEYQTQKIAFSISGPGTTTAWNSIPLYILTKTAVF